MSVRIWEGKLKNNSETGILDKRKEEPESLQTAECGADDTGCNFHSCHGQDCAGAKAPERGRIIQIE